MYIVIMHKHSFTQYQYLCDSVTYNEATGEYTIHDTGGELHTYLKSDYLIAIMS